MTAITDNNAADPKAGRKFDQGKRKLSLLPAGVLNETLDVLLFGASKYAEDNWKYVPGARKRYYDALYRHVDLWWSGEKTDPETGKHHLAHAVCCAMFLMWFDLSGQDAVEEKTVVKEEPKTLLIPESETIPPTLWDSLVQEDATKPSQPTRSSVISKDFWVGIPNRVFGKNT